MRDTFLNSQFQLLHFKCFDLLIQNWLSLFDQATCLTKLIVFCSCFVLFFFFFFLHPFVQRREIRGNTGSPREQGAGEGSIWGVKAGAEIKKTHSYFVYNRLSSSFKTSSYLTSTDALKIISWARKCRFILRLIKQHSLSSNRIPIEFGYTIGHEWSDINCVQICQCLANCSRQNSSAHITLSMSPIAPLRRFKVKDFQKLSTKAPQTTRQDQGKTCYVLASRKLHRHTRCIFL